MSRFAVLLLAASGCVPPGTTVTDVEGVYLNALPLGDGFDVELINDSSEPITVGCRGYGCERSSLRYEALQASGAWEVIQFAGSWSRHRDQRRVGVGAAMVVEPVGPFAQAPIHGPGTYRAVVRFQTESREEREVGLEVSAIGWSAEVMGQAEALLARAEHAECRYVRRRIDAGIVAHLDPDSVTDRHANAREEERFDLAFEMVNRGGFGDYLSEHVALASIEEVHFIASNLARTSPETRRQLRQGVVRRFLGALDDAEPLTPRLLRDIEVLSDAWPEDAAPRIVERIASGPERGASLAGLINLLIYTRDTRVTEYRLEISSAVEARCAGAEEAPLREACERARNRFDPAGGGASYGRAFGWGGADCGIFGATEACARIQEQWVALRDRADPLELVFH